MPRTTIDIDAPLLRDLKRLQKREGKTLGRLVSDLLAQVLGSNVEKRNNVPLRWLSKPMNAKVNLEDKEAVWMAMEPTAGNKRSE